MKLLLKLRIIGSDFSATSTVNHNHLYVRMIPGRARNKTGSTLWFFYLRPSHEKLANIFGTLNSSNRKIHKKCVFFNIMHMRHTLNGRNKLIYIFLICFRCLQSLYFLMMLFAIRAFVFTGPWLRLQLCQ